MKRVQELDADVLHLIGTRREPLGVLDGKRMRSMATRAWYAISNSIGVGRACDRASIS